MATNIASNMLELIGNTPLVRLNKLAEGLAAEVVVKLELFNPTGSVKDRPALAMLEAAARNGWLDRERAVIESLLAIRRAGADLVITYYAELLAKLLPK